MTGVTCPSCGAAVAAGFKFCGECGAKLPAPAAAHPAPPAGAPAATPSAKRDEFRDVTVLFADVTGFTALAEHLDPEALHALMNACFDGLGRIVQAHGGHIDKYIGDSIMALFGAPTAHEDDPLRAGEAALAMQAFLTAFRVPGSKDTAAPFRMRIGINSGLVLAGSIGTEGKRDYSVMGDAVNTASRLESQARPGSILVSDAYKRRVERQFALAGPHTVALKGKDRPVTAWELLGEAAEAVDLYGQIQRRFFTGRQHEIMQIVRLLSPPADQREVSWLDIRGPLGVGKTHLVEEALRHMPGRTALHVVSRPATSLRPFALARRALLGLAANLSGVRTPPDTIAVFASALGPLSQDLEPYLNALWYIAAPDSLALKAPDPDPLTFRRTVERGLERLLVNLARALPDAVIVFDAYELADTETRGFLDSVYRAPDLLLPAVIAIMRPDDRITTPAKCSVNITLGPLSPVDAEYLARHAASSLGANLDARTLHDILARAQGIPLFIQELVRSVQEQVAVRDGAAALPSSLLGVMSSRLDRLEPGQRDALAQCAVQGVEFSAGIALVVWTARGGEAHSLAAHLKDLEDRGFIEAPNGKTRRYAFTQALMQNACYDTMLKRDRRVLHRDVAHALVLQAGTAQAVSPESLATHYELSEQWLEAAAENLRAGQRAAGLFANTDALARFERALKALAEHGAPGKRERQITYAAHRGRAQVHLRIGAYGDLENDANAMRSFVRDERERCEAIRLLAQGRLHRGDLNSASQLLADAEQTLPSVKREDAAAQLADGEQAAPGVACRVLFDLADLNFRKGDNEAARAYILRCRAIVPEACPELLRLDILDGRVAHTEGRFHDAVALYERAHAAAAGMGSLSEQALTSNYMGNAARDVGRYQDAEHYFTRALDIWSRVGLTESIAGAHNNLANLAISRGDAARAEHHYALALEAFETIANTAGTALARTNLAILAIEQDRAADGVGNASKAKALLIASGNRMLLGLASVVLGEAQLAAGATGLAADEFAWIVTEYTAVNHPLAIAGALRGNGRVAIALGKGGEAVAPLQAALALYEKLAREQEAGRTEVFLAQAYALAHDPVAARLCLERALARFARIGAQGDLAKAQAALAAQTFSL
jgi:adenylate cyclase